MRDLYSTPRTIYLGRGSRKIVRARGKIGPDKTVPSRNVKMAELMPHMSSQQLWVLVQDPQIIKPVKLKSHRREVLRNSHP